MRRVIVVAALVLAGCGPGEPAPVGNGVTANGITLVSDRIALPEETAALPAGHDLVAATCTACHSAEMLITQPPLTSEKWQATIDKMRTVYKASIDPSQDKALIKELTSLPTQMPQ